MVILLGEAGIGKSRLVQEFRTRIADDPRFGFRYQCSPHHTNSAFYPVIEHLKRAEGVPLYVEELTKTMVEVEDTPEGDMDLLPATLQTSLVAGLDRLGEAKAVAQIGSVIGREFDHRLLAWLARETGVALEVPLQQLVDSGLVIRRGAPPDAPSTSSSTPWCRMPPTQPFS